MTTTSTKLPLGKIDDAYTALVLLDREEGIKLAPDALLKVAINMNLLEPIARGYQRSRTRLAANLNAANRALAAAERRSDAELQADLADQDQTNREEEKEIDGLRTLLKSELRLADNPKITFGYLAKLWPLLEGME